MNALLVVVDALRTDRIGAYTNSSLTPNIDKLAENGEVFEQAYACINATDPSVTTILTGQYPTRHGVLNHGGNVTQDEREFVSGTPSLPELLDHTHSTVGLDLLERWHQRGFDKYRNPLRNDPGARSKLAEVAQRLPNGVQHRAKAAYNKIRDWSDTSDPYFGASEITDEAIDTIERVDSPWFVFTHYWDAHVPYSAVTETPSVVRDRSYGDGDIRLSELFESLPDSPWKTRLTEELIGDAETVGDMKRKYDSGVYTVDKHLGRLIEQLEREGELEETIIVVTADHGESLTEHDIHFDHHGLYDPQVHVPFIIYAPGFDGREEEFVQHFDIVPTILSELGVEYQEEQFDGVSLVPDSDGTRLLKRDAVYMEEAHTARKRAIRTNDYKYIKRLGDRDVCRYCAFAHAAKEELYELHSDPEERENRVDERPEVVNELDEKLEWWIDDKPAPERRDVLFEESDQVTERLESMGYL